MTRDHRRKKAIRVAAAASGRTYLDAASSFNMSTGGPVLAESLRANLAAALEATGWPVEIEHNAQLGALRTYFGPAMFDVVRDNSAGPDLFTGDEHPDDPAVFDLQAPLRVLVWAPRNANLADELGRVAGIDGLEIPADGPVDALAAEVNRVVGAARHRDVADTPAAAACGICADRYPEAALFTPTRAQVRVCPCCAFDGDLVGAVDPSHLAYQLDRAGEESVALPAGWAAVQVLLACLGGPTLQRRLAADWRARHTLYEPGDEWADPLRAWTWLPPASARPAALAHLGSGASMAAIATAIDRGYPDLRERFRDREDEIIAEYLDDEYGDDVRPGDDDRMRLPAQLVDRLWPAVLAYAIAMLTQQAERPDHRDPWHVLESFELPAWTSVLDPDVDSYQAETVLRIGIDTVRETFDPASRPGE
jgi:hypothetical protein